MFNIDTHILLQLDSYSLANLCYNYPKYKNICNEIDVFKQDYNKLKIYIEDEFYNQYHNLPHFIDRYNGFEVELQVNLTVATIGIYKNFNGPTY